MIRGYMTASALLSAILFAAAPASAAPRPRSLNWHLMKKKPAVSTATVSGVEESTAPAKGEPVRLMAGRWTPEVRAAIEKLIADKGRGAPGYDPKVPPVAVLPWSDAAVAGDPAELVFLKLVTEVKFKIDDSWWELVPIGYGRQPTRAAYEQFVTLSTEVWRAQPSYDGWRKGMLSSYLALCRGVGRKECRSYLARLWAGWRLDEAQDYSKGVLDDEKKRVTAVEMVPGEPGDRKPLRARRGLRVIPEIRDLVAKLRAAGFDVWVIDDLPQPVLAAATLDYGIDPSRAYGVQNSTEGARMGADVLRPVPTRGGKAEAVQAQLGRPADLVIGRDAADADVLAYGDGLRIALDGDPELVKTAGERGWLVQRAFAR
jgi:phosphoserine phosphatase